ncbi:MAG: ParA family protein [Hyphomonas sp.]
MISVFGYDLNWAQILAGFIGVQILGLCWSRTRHLLANLWDGLFRFVPAVYRFHDMRRHFRAGGNVWDYRRIRRLRKSQRDRLPKVLTVMNFKGGVGKTTLVANLACSMATKFNLRVLVVDLDYQGSLSSLLQPANIDPGRLNLVGDWLKSKNPNGVSAEFFAVKSAYPDLSIDVMTSNYALTEIENNQLQRWLLHADEGTVDLPNKFARTLISAQNKFDQYDIILMDAPPRLSVAGINALVASSHVLIPVKLEPLATEPVARMLEQLNQLKVQFGAKFEVLGSVANMTYRESPPTQNERTYLTALSAALPSNAKIYRPFIPDKDFIGRPSTTSVAYMLKSANGRLVKAWFNRLAEQILLDMGIEVSSSDPSGDSSDDAMIVAAE